MAHREKSNRKSSELDRDQGEPAGAGQPASDKDDVPSREWTSSMGFGSTPDSGGWSSATGHIDLSKPHGLGDAREESDADEPSGKRSEE
jgi:hypothetical protein